MKPETTRRRVVKALAAGVGVAFMTLAVLIFFIVHNMDLDPPAWWFSLIFGLPIAVGVVLVASMVVWAPLHALGVRSVWAAITAGLLIGAGPMLSTPGFALYSGLCGGLVGWTIWRVAYGKAQ